MKSLIFALALQSANPTAQSALPPPDMGGAQPPLMPLTQIHRRDMRCGAAFAIIASEQQRSVASALAYPPLAKRGQQYFADTATRVMAETGMDAQQVGLEYQRIVAALQQQAVTADDPEAVVQAVMTPCLGLLDQQIPPSQPPTIIQCAAALEIAYDTVFAREGLSKTAQDMQTLAAVLESRSRDELRAAGYSGNEADAELVLTKEQLLDEAALADAKGQALDFDYEHCFELAAP